LLRNNDLDNISWNCMERNVNHHLRREGQERESVINQQLTELPSGPGTRTEVPGVAPTGIWTSTTFEAEADVEGRDVEEAEGGG
jgi:hypothetical protein